jgi:hypothetical protein
MKKNVNNKDKKNKDKKKNTDNSDLSNKQKKNEDSYKPREKKIIKENEIFVNEIKDFLGDDLFYQIDIPIINYIANILNAQNNPLTKILEEDVKELINEFFYQTEISKNKEDSKKLTSELFENLYKKEILLHVQEQESAVEVLENAVNLGKGYDDKLIEETNVSKLIVNTNEDIDWEKHMSKIKADKKKKKEDLLKKEEEKRYKNYLKMKGISDTKEIIKVHNSDFVSGTRDIHLKDIR